jgi:hypothetical protein
MKRLRVATWNLDWWKRYERQMSPWELIQRAEADIFALQEVRSSELLELHPVLRFTGAICTRLGDEH